MNDKPRIVVAGGTGMIGRRASSHLVESGYEVVVLTRGPSDTSRSETELRLIHWDPETESEWRAEIDGALAVINLCGETG